MPTLAPDVDADGNIETPEGQANEKKKNKNLTIAGVALGGIGIAIVIYMHAKSAAAAAAGTTTTTSATAPTTGTLATGGPYGGYSGGGNSDLDSEFQAIQAALTTITGQVQTVQATTAGIAQQNQAIGTMLLTGAATNPTTGATAILPSTKGVNGMMSTKVSA